jgi:hypothetical protein
MLKRWGMLVLGLGIGLIAGGQAGQALLVPGLVAVVAGAAMIGAGGRDPVDLVQVPASATAPAGEPRAAGLGNRVEEILRLAEDQARAHREAAEREAAAVIAEAREEAARLRANG